jgi:hypothetical protein
MPLILGANSASGGYNVANSLRFNSGSSDYLNRTLSTPTNNKIYTWSGWIKKTKNDEVAPNIFGAHSGGLRDCIRFDGGGNALQMIFNEVGSGNLVTTQVLRDVSAWYHIVVAVDTTQATSTNRVKIYLNGSQITSFSTSSYPAQNYTNILNAANPHVFGKNADLSNEFFNGYIAETYFIDGQQLTPSSFGETDTLTGIWKPKAYVGTFGNNGFYLQFKNSAALGTDSSGNGNTFTVNNLTSIDQTTDTPTNNFCTLNPLASGVAIGGVGGNFTEGNTIFTGGSANWCTSKGTFSVTKGKWYFESKQKTNANGSGLGSATVAVGFSQLQSNLGNYNPVDGNIAIYIITLADNGWVSNFNANATQLSPAYALQDGDIVGIALDLDTNAYNFYINGSSKKSGSLDTLYDGNGLTPCIIQYGGDTRNSFFNFGNPSYTANGYTDAAGYGNFSYAVPSGYYALNTKNLANFG